MPPVGRQWKRMCVSAGCIDMDSPACLCIFPLLEFTINRVNKTKNPTQKIHVPELFFLRPQWPCMVTHTCTEVQGSHARRGASFNRAATKSFAVIDKKKTQGWLFWLWYYLGATPPLFREQRPSLFSIHPFLSLPPAGWAQERVRFQKHGKGTNVGAGWERITSWGDGDQADAGRSRSYFTADQQTLKFIFLKLIEI